ncbi:acyltransferase family protein [Microbacterium sp. GXF0217]
MTGASPRIGWMDAVRGLAIALLLIWHSSAVPELYGVEMPEIIRTINAFLMPYRMPTLMLLSGLLLERSMRKPLPAYYAGKLAMILWPYVIWVLVARATFLDIEGLPWWHWRGWYATSYLWFLFFIGVYYLVAPLFARLPAWVPVAIAVTAGLVLPYGSVEQRMGYFAVFFFCGHWLATRPRVLDRIVEGRWVLLLALPVIGFGTAACIWTDQIQYAVWGAPASIAGALLCAAVFSRIGRGGRGQPVLRFIGRSSIVFYVSHFPVMALITIATADRLHPLILALINLAAAGLFGWLLAIWKGRVPVVWLFQAPRPLTRGAERLLSRAGPRRTR